MRPTTNGNTGISADPRKLPQMKLQRACTATPVFERALRESLFRPPALYRFCQAAILAGPEAVRQPMNATTTSMAEAAELVSLLQSSRRFLRRRREVAQEAVGSAILPRIPQRRKLYPKLLALPALLARPTERPLHHLQTERLQQP
jgi:hypothetical protein